MPYFKKKQDHNSITKEKSQKDILPPNRVAISGNLNSNFFFWREQEWKQPPGDIVGIPRQLLAQALTI